MYLDFVPGYPETPVYVAPANQALGVGTSVTWLGRRMVGAQVRHLFRHGQHPAARGVRIARFGDGGRHANKESYTFTGLQPGVTYYWRVAARRWRRHKADGTTISRTKTGPTYSFTTSGASRDSPAPTSLTAQAASPTHVNLSWTDVAGEEGFKVERKLSSSSTWSQIGTTSAERRVLRGHQQRPDRWNQL